MLFHYTLRITKPKNKSMQVTSSAKMATAAGVAKLVLEDYRHQLANVDEFELKVSKT